MGSFGISFIVTIYNELIKLFKLAQTWNIEPLKDFSCVADVSGCSWVNNLCAFKNIFITTYELRPIFMFRFCYKIGIFILVILYIGLISPSELVSPENNSVITRVHLWILTLTSHWCIYRVLIIKNASVYCILLTLIILIFEH